MATWTCHGSASVRKRLSCTLPDEVTIRYSIRASFMLTTAGKLTVLRCLSSRTLPSWKMPGAICLSAILVAEPELVKLDPGVSCAVRLIPFSKRVMAAAEDITVVVRNVLRIMFRTHHRESALIVKE